MAKTKTDPGVIPCPTCGGGGYIIENRPIRRKDGEIHHEDTAIPCPQCDTAGNVRA